MTSRLRWLSEAQALLSLRPQLPGTVQGPVPGDSAARPPDQLPCWTTLPDRVHVWHVPGLQNSSLASDGRASLGSVAGLATGAP